MRYKIISRIKRFKLGCHIYGKELLYILKVWRYYIPFRVLHRHDEPEKYLYEKFKNEPEKYTHVLGNIKYDIRMKHYDFFDTRLKKLVEIPYKYFQVFPNKEKNIVLGEKQKFHPKTMPMKVTGIKPFTYYEGITFSNIVFEDFELKDICFHNCSFWNCKFQGLKSRKDYYFNFSQGFSMCDFYKCDFDNCELNNIFFSMGRFEFVNFINVIFQSSILQRMSFKKVVFKEEIFLNNTYIYSPSNEFDISFNRGVNDIHIDARSKVTAFLYYDRINYSLESWMLQKECKIMNYEDIANTYHILEQIWNNNNIRESDYMICNFYYQRKRAETRSKKKSKKFIGYLTELVIGYGEKPYNALISLGVIAFVFSAIYMFTGFSPEVNYSNGYMKYFQSLYYSFFTLITVGQGNARPDSIGTQIAMSVELFLGAILMTLFTSTLFRKYTK